MAKKEDKADNTVSKPIFKRSTPVEVTMPLRLPAVRHIISPPPLPEGSLYQVESRIVKIDTAHLPKIEEVQAMLAGAIERKGQEEKKEKEERKK